MEQKPQSQKEDQKEEIKIPELGIAQKNGNHSSIKSKLKKVIKLDEQNDEDQDDKDELDFEDTEIKEESIRKAFKVYSGVLEKRNRPGEAMLLKNELRIENNIIHLKINNPVEEARYGEMKSDLLLFLRKTVQNKTLEINLEITKDDIKKIIYTPQEKFDFMAEKNPALIELKRRLGLEFEY